ncbi:MAG: anaerobic sulfatase maturase [Chitinivibrionales bacterium]|nr:anaerobic sulfatase maturase [Chitinivibrionales bacterium]MBD3397213.1 anaerobic sulfatase maturase [Chitinivibrionales bacterium]
MKPFSLLIKPASADCNLRCEYCFYLDRAALYPETRTHRMSDSVLEKMIQSYMATSQPVYSFGWQGGEPALMGADFFRRVVDLQKKHGRAGSSVSNGVQTNGVLITDELAAHFAEYRFLAGVSLDGPPAIHDRYRRYAGGRGSHADVLKGIDRLRAHGVDFNILVLVNSENAGRAAEVYRYLRDNGFLFHQYIPCVEFDRAGNLRPFAITGEQWGAFLCGLFDAWHASDTRRVSIRLFDAVLSYMVDNTYTICHMHSTCCQYFVVEHNGDIYPCDFFVGPGLRIGNVMTISWDQAQKSPVYTAFGRNKPAWNPACARCEYLPYCAGDCLKHRLPVSGDPATLSWLCKGWKRFFAHTLPRFEALAELVKRERELAPAACAAAPFAAPAAPGTAGRNDPCPCGSGLKFKKCCGKSGA